MKLKKLAILLFFISNVTAIAQNRERNKEAVITEKWESLIENNYSIKYPKSWELNKPGPMGSSFILFSPISYSKDQFKENVNLIIQDLTGYNLDLDKYVEISEGQIKTLISDGNIIESHRITNEDLNFQKIIYTGKQGVFELKFEQYYWVIKDKAYVLTLTCEISQFEKYQKIGERILNSFEILSY